MGGVTNSSINIQASASDGAFTDVDLPPHTASPHLPVMVEEVCAALAPSSARTIIDGTLGAGGYTRSLLARGARVIALDRDPDAIAMAERSGLRTAPNITIHHLRFSEMEEVAEPSSVQGVVLDIGVSSMQLDQAERGFSFRGDGPLDMRMSQAGPSAADVVNGLSETDLLRVIGIYGEERAAPRIAREIVRARADQPFTDTRQLAQLIERVSPARPGDRIHPATRTFQGLRIYVNDELGELVRGLEAAERVLAPDGVLAVVTFHSLEDRIVKRFIADRSKAGGGSRHLPSSEDRVATFEPFGKQGRGASDEEIASNPRARSARLRAARRTSAPARRTPGGSLPNLPSIDTLGGGR